MSPTLQIDSYKQRNTIINKLSTLQFKILHYQSTSIISKEMMKAHYSSMLDLLEDFHGSAELGNSMCNESAT